MKKLIRGVVFILITMNLTIKEAQAQTTNYQVLSLFVMNITKYSLWPDATGDIHIAVLGKSKVYDELLKVAPRGVNGRKVVVIQSENVADVSSANLVYISDNKSSQLDDLVKVTTGKPVVIVTEREGLHKKGAGFSFLVNENNNLRFDINNTDLEKRGIKVSKNLSSLAHEIM